jgi:hypothetical protein
VNYLHEAEPFKTNSCSLSQNIKGYESSDYQELNLMV